MVLGLEVVGTGVGQILVPKVSVLGWRMVFVAGVETDFVVEASDYTEVAALQDLEVLLLATDSAAGPVPVAADLFVRKGVGELPAGS